MSEHLERDIVRVGERYLFGSFDGVAGGNPVAHDDDSHRSLGDVGDAVLHARREVKEVELADRNSGVIVEQKRCAFGDEVELLLSGVGDYGGRSAGFDGEFAVPHDSSEVLEERFVECAGCREVTGSWLRGGQVAAQELWLGSRQRGRKQQEE